MNIRKFIIVLLLMGILSMTLSACASQTITTPPIATTIRTTSMTKPETTVITTQAVQRTFTVNQSGGKFPDRDSGVVMVFATGSVTKDTNISITTVSSLSENVGYIPGTTYAFGPDGTVFNNPVQLTIKYNPANIPSGLQENMLCLAKLTNRSWQPVEDSKVDTASKTVTGSIAGFSTYGLIGSDMTVTFESQPCFPGTEVTITPVVHNAPPGYQLQYKWSTDGKYGDLVGTPDEKTGAITYKAKVNAPDRASENVQLEIFTYFASADTPPKYTHYTWLTATTTVAMNFPTISIDSYSVAPNEAVTLIPLVNNQPPGYQLQYKWSTDGIYGQLIGTPDEKSGAITYKAKADAPDGATENIRVEMFTQFATADTPPIMTDYVWDSASATITIGVLSFKFDLVQTVPGVPGTVTTHVMVRHHKVKMVTGTAGKEVVHLFYYDAHIEYWYTGTEGRKQSIDPSAKSPDDINYLSQFSQYKTVGTEKIDGKSCQIKQTVKNGTTLKIWIWEEKNLPMRIQTTSSQGHIIIEDYKNYEFVPIPESEFMLPSTVIIR